MGKRILIAVIAVLFTVNAVSAAASGSSAPLIDRPSSFDKSTKGEKGIFGTLVLIYTKTRNAVKFAYNEIMYFKEMQNNYKAINRFLKKEGKAVASIWDSSTKLFTNPEDVFVTLKNLEDIFNNVDYECWAIPYQFDQLMAQTELTYDKMVGEKFEKEAVFAAMVPNTAGVIRYVDKEFGFDKLPANQEQAALTIQQRENRLGSGFKLPEEELVKATKIVAASTMSNAAMYKNWAVKASARMPKTDANFAKVKGANGFELAACWYAIDETNSNNKLLRNHLEELKLLQASLGIYIFDVSDEMRQRYQYKNDLRAFATAMEDAAQ